MLRRAAIACVLLVLPACFTSGGALATTLPAGLPSSAVLADWERIEGAFETPAERVQYALFVDPERPALYRITQYRVTARGGGLPAAETVIWNETPGRRVPLRCFAEVRTRSWHTLWLVPRSAWRDVPPATTEFRTSMLRAIQIYHRVDAEGRSGPPAANGSPPS